MPKSKLWLLNFLFVQFFWMRVFWYVDDDGTTGYGVLGPVIPMTGWWNKYLPRPKIHWKLSANTKIKD